MKKTSLITALLGPFLLLQAQRQALPTPEDLTHFLSTKTYVVLNANPMSDYNFEIQDAVEKYWDITEYEVIDNKEFAAKSVDANASFLYVAAVNFEKDKSGTRYMFLCLSLGGGDHKSLDDLQDITNLPLGYHGVDEENYAYKMGTLLRFMQQHVELLIADPARVSQNVFQMYNQNMAGLSEKTLYLVQDEIEPSIASEAGLRSVYPHPFQIVEREEIKEIIMKGDENAAFLHKVGPEGKKQSARVYKAIVGVSDAQFYYYNHHKASAKKPDAILFSDFKRIARASKSK